ncbi:hypothetical protein A9Q92_07740 [Methylophaga sp. 42_8_T64]|nr:hypothetical protein A9Q78_08005 [Methylophaga sp. 41_12_T18]OUR85612.1 hypothetical protein A9Q92_07740 [Methylophaga sp. 42_8_T64]
MDKTITALSNYLDGLTLREKLLFVFVFIAVVYSAWDAFFFSSYSEQQQQIHTESLATQTQQQETILAIQLAQIELSKADPNIKINQQIKDAQLALSDAQQQLNAKLDKLVPPTQITNLLRSLLEKTQGISLVSLENEPVSTITLNTAEEDEVQTVLYEHATKLNLRGSYQQLHKYLQALESSDWGLFWDQLDYTVKDYPDAEISLRVHTISTDEYWIGL